MNRRLGVHRTHVHVLTSVLGTCTCTASTVLQDGGRRAARRPAAFLDPRLACTRTGAPRAQRDGCARIRREPRMCDGTEDSGEESV